MAAATSRRAAALASQLNQAVEQLIAVIEPIDGHGWRHLSDPAVWSISKEAEHIADATVYHQWIVRTTIGERVGSRKPRIERKQMVSDYSPAEIIALIRERADNGVRLIRGLSDAQLDLPTRPPRARDARLAETIENMLIGHYNGHRAEIETKLTRSR